MQTKTLVRRVLAGKFFGDDGGMVYTHDAIEARNALRKRRQAGRRMRKARGRTSVHM